MLYLIGGPPRCGKTNLAESLARKLEITYFSIDHITSVITPYVAKEVHKDAFPLGALFHEVNRDNDLLFQKYTPTDIVEAYVKQAETCWPGIRNFIRYAIEDDHSLILEGWQILPRFLSEMGRTPRVHVRFLYKANPQAILSGLRSGRPGKDWVLDHTKNDGTYIRIAEMISHFGTQIRDEAAASGFDATNMDVDFERRMKELSLIW